ncbi:zinc finger protein 723-like [Phlebotomus papatasi]|uniref:zinc finger protein 723-like n=1 Tax=Phlebotomus papatasi TaxID=29031 RepID=UPI0024834473|nr:zinc finger protein 723-like [Phlebotomus papatasi]
MGSPKIVPQLLACQKKCGSVFCTVDVTVAGSARGEKKRNAPEIREDLLEFIMKNKTAECSSGAKKRKSKVNTVKVQQTPKETSKNESINGHDNKSERPFKCEICSRTFNMRQALSTHMRLHRLDEEDLKSENELKDVVDFETLIDETRSSDSGTIARTPRAGSKRKAP